MKLLLSILLIALGLTACGPAPTTTPSTTYQVPPRAAKAIQCEYKAISCRPTYRIAGIDLPASEAGLTKLLNDQSAGGWRYVGFEDERGMLIFERPR